MLRHLKLYPHYLSMAIKTRLIYKVDAIVGIASFLLSNACGLAAVFLMLNHVPSLGGYTFENLMFIYGFLLIPKSVDHVFSDAIWYIGTSYVVKGEMDKYLTRPLNPLFQVIAEVFQPEGFGELILAIALLAVYAPAQGIAFGFFNIAPLVVCGFFAIFVFTAVKLFTASLAFMFKRSIVIMVGFYSLSDFAKYPIKIFGRVLQFVLTFVVPFSLVLFLPVGFVIEGESLAKTWLLTAQVALTSTICIVFAYLFWLWCLRKYDSPGS